MWEVEARKVSEGWEDCEWKRWPGLSCHFSRLSEDRIVSGRPCRLDKTCSLRPKLLTDAISHTGSETTRFQSHHCCEGNCSSLSHKSAPLCALQAKTYIYPLSQQYTHTHTQTKAHWILSSLSQNKKTTEFVAVLLFISLTLCNRIHHMSTMFPWLTVFIWALRAHHATYSHLLYWMETCTWNIGRFGVLIIKPVINCFFCVFCLHINIPDLYLSLLERCRQ